MKPFSKKSVCVNSLLPAVMLLTLQACAPRIPETPPGMPIEDRLLEPDSETVLTNNSSRGNDLPAIR